MMKTILIVDDSKTIRQMLRNALKNEPYTIVEASNGREGLTIVQTSTPDAVVSDIHMPDVDGITFISSVRSDPRLKALPILVLTTEDESLFKERARAAGATAWLQKPFKDKTLQQALKRLFG
ncbi:response regulator [Agrobacterium tumefaciens]|uniref:Response regulator n=1 Tax=Agrobacterium tumefaciens TaxID=358 RepID=A0AA44F6Z1_AGRTU|nr:response regulator [Agrobacterium tumefaciens]NTB87519.1 response regulator [Agrobacterium tumefaciens]NTC17504.1 response regulator [Agrobacterium tumefaciens]NTC29714.1 response regulator [Agrobacterium tumefaciens]